MVALETFKSKLLNLLLIDKDTLTWTIFGTWMGLSYLAAEVIQFRDCRRDGGKYKLVIYLATVGLSKEIGRTFGSIPRRILGKVKGKKYKSKYPIRHNSEGYILQDDAPLLEQNDHLTVRESNGFIVGRKNTNGVIGSLDELVGFSVEQLERRMYPDNQTFAYAEVSGYLGSNPEFGGFLKEGEKLIPRLVVDNDCVLSLGLSHQDVAKPLLYIYNLMHRTGTLELRFIYEGRKYETAGNFWPIGQMSPFSNKLVVPAGDVTVKNVADERIFKFSTIHPFMIHGFGFYEGDVRYRIEPQDVINFFGITATNDRTPSS